jgi:hypothetical protein
LISFNAFYTFLQRPAAFTEKSEAIVHMCKERPVIPVNRVVDMKRIIRKNGGGGEAQGVADKKDQLHAVSIFSSREVDHG